MKRSLLYFLGIGLMVFGFSACEEVPPFIDYSDNSGGNGGSGTEVTFEEIYNDTTFVTTDVSAKQDRVVVMEEFTGVACVNCPLGHEESQDLLDTHGDRLALVAVHANWLNYISGESIQFLTTSEAGFILNLCQVEGLPSASIDRVQFDNEDVIAIDQLPKWASKINERLSVPTELNLHVYNDYNSDTRELTVYTQIRYTEDVSDQRFISIMLTEGGIIEPQELTDGSIDEEYEQEHVLRGMITPPSGDAINETLEAGRVIVKSYSFTVPSEWDPAHMEVVAFVHGATNTPEIIQGAKEYVIK